MLVNKAEAAEKKESIINKLFINAEVPAERIELISDTDWDGIPNLWEINYGFDPNSPYDADIDPDQDGLNNLQEYNYNLHPRVFDSNRGGLLDGDQINDKTNPRAKVVDKLSKVEDSDNDNLPDWWELVYDHDLSLRSENTDPDADGLSDYLEYLYGSNPNYFDTDKDKVTDGIEVVIAQTSPVRKDSDYDNLSDFDEINKYGTDLLEYDSDGDGLSDGDEILNGTDPLDPLSLANIPDLKFFYREMELPYEKSEIKLLLDSSVELSTEKHELEVDLKRGKWDSKSSEVNLPNREQKVPATIHFKNENGGVIGKKYIYLDSQAPLTVYKHGQYLSIFGYKFYADKFFYGKIGRFFKINNIYLIENARVYYPGGAVETNLSGVYPLMIDKSEGILKVGKRGYGTTEIELEEGVFNPVLKLEKIYNLSWIVFLLLLLLFYWGYRSYKRRKNIDKKGKST